MREEYAYPCSPIWRAGRERGFLFRLTYYHKRVNLEVFHALSDGMGTARFLQIILMCYFSILDGSALPQEYIREYCDRVARDSDEDSFARNSGMSGAPDRKKKEREPEAFHIQGFKYDDTRLGVLTASLPTEKMARARARKGRHHVRVYVRAADLVDNEHVIQALDAEPTGCCQSSGQSQEYVRSTTMRNFFGHVSIGVRPRRGMTFDEVLSEVKERFDSCLTREYFERQIDANVGIEKIGPVKFVPVWIKDLVMRILFAPGGKTVYDNFLESREDVVPGACRGEDTAVRDAARRLEDSPEEGDALLV